MDFEFSPEDEAYRRDVRQWLSDHHPGKPPAPHGSPQWLQWAKDWQRQAYDAGYLGIGWPQAYGGVEGTLTQQVVLAEEMVQARVPGFVGQMGMRMLAPTLMRYGTEAQKQTSLPPILKAEQIWFGAGRSRSPIPVEAVMRRVAQLGNGWFPSFQPDDTGHETISRLHDYAREAGRDPADIGMEARINVADGSPDAWAQQAEAWSGLGATHLSVNTMSAALGTTDAHIQAIRQFKDAVGS